MVSNYRRACSEQRQAAKARRFIEFDGKHDINKGNLPPDWVFHRCMEVEIMVRWMIAH